MIWILVLGLLVQSRLGLVQYGPGYRSTSWVTMSSTPVLQTRLQPSAPTNRNNAISPSKVHTSKYRPGNRALRSGAPTAGRILGTNKLQAIDNNTNTISPPLSMQRVQQAASAGQSALACRLFQQLLVELECPVTVRDCNVLLRVLGDQGALSFCTQIFQLMLTHSPRLSPSLVTYSTLISRAGTWQRVDLARYFFDHMQVLHAHTHTYIHTHICLYMHSTYPSVYSFTYPCPYPYPYIAMHTHTHIHILIPQP
ncbi:hypothetical protein EON65_49650, partial [archaeon]